jgi:hypothetical protein
MQIKACQNGGQLWSDLYRRLAAVAAIGLPKILARYLTITPIP